jgi:hypothetical protein
MFVNPVVTRVACLGVIYVVVLVPALAIASVALVGAVCKTKFVPS